MIKAKHTNWAQYVWDYYLNRQFKKHFHAFYLVHPPSNLIRENHSVLLLVNHSTWWDGFFLFWLNRKYLNKQIYLMMEEDQLKKFPFFRRLGTYGVNRRNPGSLRASLDYSLQILSSPAEENHMLAIFPQGVLEPSVKKPIRFQRGIDFLLHRIPQSMLIQILIIKIEYLREQRPEVFFSFGEPLFWPSQEINSAFLEQKMNDQDSLLMNEIRSGQFGEQVFTGQTSIHKRFGMR
ncbi:MAG: hydroxychlorobactene glucoside lauroyltransferase CruD [Calditrichia bacterium]